ASGSPTTVPPPSWIALNIDGLSVAAQRGCWKLFHEMPTLQAVAPPPPLPPGAALPPPPPPQADRANVRAASTANVLRMNSSSSDRSLRGATADVQTSTLQSRDFPVSSPGAA